MVNCFSFCERVSVTRAIILASGGLDSSVTAAVAKSEGDALYFLTVDYGQRHRVEIQCAGQIARFFQAQEHKVVSVDLRLFGGSALTGDMPVPMDRGKSEREQDIPVTYVPARNTIFLSLALAYAETVGAGNIYFGANVRDYSGYPDCRPEYIQAFQEVARLGTRMGVEGRSVKIRAPLLMLTKGEIIRKGRTLGVPFHLTSSCYKPDPSGRPCGHCDSCLIRREGFREIGVEDPRQAG